MPPAVLELDQDWAFAYALSAPRSEFMCLDEALRAGVSFQAAQVPGNLELDLQRNDMLPDVFQGRNIALLRELEQAHVWYVCRFKALAVPGHIARLVFEGIDCCATIILNGEILGKTDNMLVEHVFDVTARLKGHNELLIHIHPALLAAKQYDYPPNVGAFVTSYDALHVRKAPHMYGWDIMPRALSAGLWRPVSLRFTPIERIETVYLETAHLEADRQRADLLLKYRVRTQGTVHDLYELKIEGSCGDSSFLETIQLFSDAGRQGFPVAEPKLWWPNGYGSADLYKVRVSLVKNDLVLDSREFDLGIRTVRLERTSVTDAAGSGAFCFHVNGERVFAKGSNWVPLDAFHSRDAGRTEAVLDLAVAAHCNMLRCWGGNVYESDRFFELCDARGLMVWQDFAMACAVYPQDESFQGRIADEALKVVRRLRQHASLVLWAGDNECDAAHQWFGQGDPNQNVLTRRVLPEVLRQEDPGRPYLPSSPYMDEKGYAAGEAYLPENHLWGPRGYYKADYYQSALCHFASEIGYHGCPDPESIRQFISPDYVWPYTNNPEWNLHSTAPVPGIPVFGPENGRVELMASQVRALFGTVPDTLEDFAFASQATQGEAMKTFIEMFRGGKWRRTGIIWWNLMDGWPQFSDAVVDYYFRKKLAYHFITRAQQHVAVMIQEPAGGKQWVVAANDTLNDLPLHYTVTDIESGLAVADGEATALANQTTPLVEIPHDASAQCFYLITWSSDEIKGVNHYLAGAAPFDLEQYRAWTTKAGVLA